MQKIKPVSAWNYSELNEWKNQNFTEPWDGFKFVVGMPFWYEFCSRNVNYLVFWLKGPDPTCEWLQYWIWNNKKNVTTVFSLCQAWYVAPIHCEYNAQKFRAKLTKLVRTCEDFCVI